MNQFLSTSMGWVANIASGSGCRRRTCAQRRPDQIGGQGGHDDPVVALEFALELTERPAGISSEDSHAFDEGCELLWIGIQIDHGNAAVHPAQARNVVDIGADAQRCEAQGGVALDRSTDEQCLRASREIGPLRQHIVYRQVARPVQNDTETARIVVLDDVDDGAPKRRFDEFRG
jgi:hypothetical protein